MRADLFRMITQYMVVGSIDDRSARTVAIWDAGETVDAARHAARGQEK